VLEAKYKQYADTNGAQGVEKRDEVEFTGEGESRRAVKEEVPNEILSGVCARDEYNARIPEERDPDRNGILYAFQAADWYFLYGQFDDARKRFTPIYEKHCGKDKWGYQAWENPRSARRHHHFARPGRDEEGTGADDAEGSSRQDRARDAAQLQRQRAHQGQHHQGEGKPGDHHQPDLRLRAVPRRAGHGW
jgi:hypothetical protein